MSLMKRESINSVVGSCNDKLLVEAGAGLLQALFVGIHHPVKSRVPDSVNLFSSGIGVEPPEGLANALGETRCGAVAGDEALDLGVLEHHAHGLVTDQRALQFRQASDEEIRGDVHDARFHAAAAPTTRYHWSHVITSSEVM